MVKIIAFHVYFANIIVNEPSPVKLRNPIRDLTKT